MMTMHITTCSPASRLSNANITVRPRSAVNSGVCRGTMGPLRYGIFAVGIGSVTRNAPEKFIRSGSGLAASAGGLRSGAARISGPP